MYRTKTLVFSLIVLSVISLQSVFAGDYTLNTVGVEGYDLVTYHTSKRPLRGNGNYAAEYKGTTYLFASEENKTEFEKNPEKYLPAYGGWCAYGVAVGKKFTADPEVWEIVNGKLYLNLDNSIKNIWSKNIAGYIVKADNNWTMIKDKSPSEL